LNANGKNFGLNFHGSMWKNCGQRYRVVAPISRLIDEKTERVRRINDTFLLEGVICDGISHRGCPRACYWMWRSDWLRKVNEPAKERIK
jgi:hypothetical protein